MMHEDELPPEMPQADYDKWFARSRLSNGNIGVRVGPRYPFVTEETSMTEQELWEREARNHAELANEYAEASLDDHEDELKTLYSLLSDVHTRISKHFAQKAGHPAEWGWA